MAATLDRMRQLLEDIDVLEKCIEDTLDAKPSSHYGALQADHVVAAALQRTQTLSRELLRIYEDADGQRREELAAMAGGAAMDTFVVKASEIRVYYARHASDDLHEEPPSIYDELKPELSFSGNEVFGKYLDMAPLHTEFRSLKNSRAMTLLQFLDHLHDLPTAGFNPGSDPRAHDRAYRGFLERLVSYLCSFVDRTQPLMPALAQLTPAFKPTMTTTLASAGPSSASSPSAGIDLATFATAKDLEALGGDALKAELLRRGLKCGGSVSQRAERLFSVRGLAPDQIPRSLVAAPAASGAVPPPAAAAGSSEASATSASDSGATDLGSDSVIPFADRFPPGAMRVAWLETALATLAASLRSVVQATRTRVERRQTLRFEELEADQAAEEEDALGGGIGESKDAEKKDGVADDDDDDPLASSRMKLKQNVALGPDGRPIPYWLYRLHELDKKFVCEICDQVLWGSRNFERHFSEAAHAAAMRALGIPNTAHFVGVTGIRDAQLLWSRLQREMATVDFDAARHEEYEDSFGNVLDRRTYEDLARQGML